MNHDREQVQQWLDSETARLLTSVETFRRRDMRDASALDDWSLGQLLTHLARNADALRNLVRWAKTRIETPMYASPTARVDDINRGALGAANVVVDDVIASALELKADLRALSEVEWQFPVRTAQGRTVPAAEIPWLRLREVALHHVDLGARTEDLPLALATGLLEDVVKTVRGKQGWPDIELEARDSAFRHAGSATSKVRVSGTSAQLLGWLTGRSDGAYLVLSGAEVPPQLPNWL